MILRPFADEEKSYYGTSEGTYMLSLSLSTKVLGELIKTASMRQKREDNEYPTNLNFLNI